jgi:ATP synthase subunit D
VRLPGSGRWGDCPARASTERGYALMTSTATIERAAESFEAELDALLELVATELNLRRLTAQVMRTTCQVNALELVVIPRLVAEQRHIAATLEQRAWRTGPGSRAAPGAIRARRGSRAARACRMSGATGMKTCPGVGHDGSRRPSGTRIRQRFLDRRQRPGMDVRTHSQPHRDAAE